MYTGTWKCSSFILSQIHLLLLHLVFKHKVVYQWHFMNHWLMSQCLCAVCVNKMDY